MSNVRYKNRTRNLDEEVTTKQAGYEKKYIITDRKILTVMSIKEKSRY